MQLSQEGVLLLGAVISFATSFIIMVVVHGRDSREIEKKREEKGLEEELFEYEGVVYRRPLRENEKATKKRLEDGLPELVAEFSEPDELELWGKSLVFGLQVGFFIFLIFWFLSCSVQAN